MKTWRHSRRAHKVVSARFAELDAWTIHDLETETALETAIYGAVSKVLDPVAVPTPEQALALRRILYRAAGHVDAWVKDRIAEKRSGYWIDGPDRSEIRAMLKRS